MNMIKLASRNLMRNYRRSMVTMLSICIGFASISLFAGYAHNVYDSLARKAIHSELLGHLTLSKRGMNKEGKLDPERYLLNGADVARISDILRDEPHVKLVAPRLALSGMISNGRASTIFIAEGIAPLAMQRLQENMLSEQESRSGMFDSFVKKLDSASSDVVELSDGLIELLHLTRGGQATMLVNTLAGQANALDVTVGGDFNTGNAGTNDKMAFVSLALAQSLYDAKGYADRLTVLLDDIGQTEPMRAHLRKKLLAAGFDLEIETWQNLSSFYNQVHGMFDMIFGFIFSIVITVVVMSIVNSMGMTVVERTREIGTLRAIGLRGRGVVSLFAVESLLLTLIGCVSGLLLTLMVRFAVNHAGISYLAPNGATPVPLLVDIDYARTSFCLLLMLTVGTLAAYVPARRAARQGIIDALGHI